MSAEQIHRLNQEVAKERELRWEKEQERDRFCQALIDLLREAGPYAHCSKNLRRECEKADTIVQELEDI